MATYKSDRKTAQDYITIDQRADRDQNLVVAQGEYVLLGTEVATDVIKLATIPAFANVIPDSSYFRAQAPGTALVGTLGYEQDVDALQTVCTLTGGGKILLDAGTAGVEIQNPVVRNTSKDVQFTISTATTLTAGAKIRFYIVYSL